VGHSQNAQQPLQAQQWPAIYRSFIGCVRLSWLEPTGGGHHQAIDGSVLLLLLLLFPPPCYPW